MPIAATDNMLNAFQLALQGTWANQALPGAPDDEGSADNPLSYNVMPLPQMSSPSGYVLKNCRVSEVVMFNPGNDVDPNVVAVPTAAPNRGALSLQIPTALYYEQQVRFAGGGPGVAALPQPQVVHTENGSWLNLITGDKLTGPYGPPTPKGSGLDDIVLQDPNQQPADITIAKQMSVPHGNSIIALGHFDPVTAGTPTIAPTSSILPVPAGLDTSQYTTTLDQENDYQNPLPDYTANPNLPLQRAVNVTTDAQGNSVQPILKVTSYLHWTVTTKKLPSGQGATINIPFEKSNADVLDYAAEYWLLATDGKAPADDPDFAYLAYSQNILLDIPINGTTYTFPHWTTNIVTKQ
jgi:hypothetical protein